MTTQEATYKYALRLGDDSLILGHRLSELCSRGPILEEDLALTNIALDMIGRTQALLKYAASIEGKEQTEDDLAYRRSENHYYNHLIMEQPNEDFAHTIARQLFVSVFEYLFYTELEKSKDKTLAAISSKAIKETIDSNMPSAIDGLIASAKRLGVPVDDSRKDGFGSILFKLTDTPENKDMTLVQALIATGIQNWPGKGYWR